MNITYEGICKKLGFDPIKDNEDRNRKLEQEYHGHEDDSRISPYSVLNEDELDFLIDIIEQHRKA